MMLTSRMAMPILTGLVLVVCWSPSEVIGAEDSGKPADRLNVILISLDTVRPDHLSCYGYHRRTTPNIDQIAKDGVLFTQAFSQAETTVPAHLSILTSRYPTKQWIFWESGDLEPSTETLTEILKRRGYAIAAFTGFGKNDKAHQPLLTSRPFLAFDPLVHEVSLKSLPQKLFDWLKRDREEPFFLFVHGFDAHQPHVLQAQYDAKRFNPTYRGHFPSTIRELDTLIASALGVDDVSRVRNHEMYSEERRDLWKRQVANLEGGRPEDLKHLLALYDAQLYYLDQGLGQLFQVLKGLDLMERTIIVLISDHGQAFGEHGMYADHMHLCDAVTRMVLIVRDPRLARRGRKVRQLVQGLDVMPTILELLDLPIPESVQGRSLVPLLKTGRDPGREEVVISLGQGMRALRTPKWRLISKAGDAAELYHVAKDPREQRNLITRHPEIAARLQHRLDAMVSAEVAGPMVDQDQWMQEHGYW